MCVSAPAVSMSLSVAAPTEASGCSTCGVSSTAPSSTSLPIRRKRSTKVCPYRSFLHALSELTILSKTVSPPGVPTSPTKPSHTLSSAPPLLRLAASPHDAHLLATFAADSNLVRILDARQPGTALLELRGHSAALNSIEWNPSRRGMLASGADDSLVLVWDLLNAGTGTGTNGSGGHAEAQTKGPSASWRCNYEVNNISWAPQSALTGQGGDWLGACGGRGIWGVKL